MAWIHNILARERSDRGMLCELLLFAGTIFLFLANLGNGHLWQDEAQTALIAKTILHGGIPLGYDGLNSFSQELGAEYGKNLVWRWHPWFPFYLLAIFFYVQISTLTARLPFALFGIATVVLVYFFVRTLWQNRRLALISALLLTASIPFLLLSRQCRYYSITAFFSLLALYGYSRIISEKRFGASIAVTALVLLFNTHYIYCAPLCLTMMIHAFIYHRARIKKIALVYAIAGILNIPGIIWYGGISYSSAYQTIHTGSQFFRFAFDYIVQLFQYVVPLLILIPVIILWITGYRTLKRFIPLDKTNEGLVVLLTLFIISSLAVLSIASPAPFFRYLSPLIPLFCILLALVVETVLKRSLIIGALIVAFLLFSNPLKEYWYELTHTYNGPVEGIVSYLNSNAKTGDIVAITYGDLPLKFYTPLRVVGGLTGEDLSPARNAEWIIIRKYVICEKDDKVRQYLEQNIDPNNYRGIRINSPDIPFENRESPGEHLYRTVQNEEPVVIYQKIRK
ncbi:MAG: glycosyltransferase family 39 protein [Desulfuromonadaceae bacterium]|nr:glycosyltransferase family 39 protein [Desulfuromonadaceae bacterium]